MSTTIDIQGGIWGIYYHGRYLRSKQYVEMKVDNKGIVTWTTKGYEKWKNRSVHAYLNYIKNILDTTTSD